MRGGKVLFAVGLIGAFLIAGVLSHLASEEPDGLERVAADLDFEHQAQDPDASVMPDYSVPGMQDSWVGGTLAGVVGTAVVFGGLMGLGLLLRRRGQASE